MSTERGLGKGDAPPAKLYTAVLEYAFRKLNWDDIDCGISAVCDILKAQVCWLYHCY